MAIRNISVANHKNIAKAEYTGLPDLVVITGPNGSGKSTLLDFLHRKKHGIETGTKILYLGPHRPWRRMNLSNIDVMGYNSTYNTAMSGNNLPGFNRYTPDGFRFTAGQSRLHDSSDELFGFIKISFLSIYIRWKNRLITEFDKQGKKIDEGTIFDFAEEVNILIKNLLPHLKFIRIDETDQNNIKCVFIKTGNTSLFLDLDDLSSGEKAIFGLFLPFIEKEILEKLEDKKIEDTIKTAVLIDEPEIHLHPQLQSNLLLALRELTLSGKYQFIITTHSPNIIEEAGYEELFLLLPAEPTGTMNQFTRVASSGEKLETIRALVGSTTTISRDRPIVFVEGAAGSSARYDKEILTILFPETLSWTIVPAGPKKQAIQNADQLSSALDAIGNRLRVCALVDKDDRDKPDSPNTVQWSVPCVENLLLDVEAIASLHSRISGRSTAELIPEIASELKEICASEISNMVQKRLAQWFGVTRLYLDATDSDISSNSEEEILIKIISKLEKSIKEKIEGKLNTERDRLISTFERSISEKSHLELFDGKIVLKKFFDRSIFKDHYALGGFRRDLAKTVRNGARLKEIGHSAVEHVKYFLSPNFPKELSEAKVEFDKSGKHQLSREVESILLLLDAYKAGDWAQWKEHLQTAKKKLLEVVRQTDEFALREKLSRFLPILEA